MVWDGGPEKTWLGLLLTGRFGSEFVPGAARECLRRQRRWDGFHSSTASFASTVASFIMALRAASCSAFFLVLPMPRAKALPAAPLSVERTSTRKRLR